MTAAALLVVLGAALLMQLGGLSMAMGAFLAGVLLSESTFRHQLEADVEPFRGILLGLFFIGVGMSLDLSVFERDWLLILGGTVALMLRQVGRRVRRGTADPRQAPARACTAPCCSRRAASSRSCSMPRRRRPGSSSRAGERPAHGDRHRVDGAHAVRRVRAALAAAAGRRSRWMASRRPSGLGGSVLVVGFGRFGQVASQSLLARGFDVVIIDTDTDMIRSAADFGFKIYYGDGTRLDVLKASGAENARAIAVCIDDRAAADRIVALAKAEFPHLKLLVRSFDREHSLKLIGAGVDFQVRETFHSAMAFGEAALVQLGVPEEEAAAIAADIRRRDAERLELEIAGGLAAGTALIHGNVPKPTPFTRTEEGAAGAERRDRGGRGRREEQVSGCMLARKESP